MSITRPPDVVESAGEPDSVHKLLNRPLAERVREYRYRLAQTLVFGLPVIALAIWGSALGANDRVRWSPLFQSLLTGWVLYVNCGMIIEPLLRRRASADGVMTTLACGLYVWSLIGVVWPHPTLFWACIALLAFWNALRMVQLSRRLRT